MSGPHIEIEIRELVLQGVAPADRYRIADAVRAELGRLFVQHGLPRALAAGAEIAHIDAGAFQVGVAPHATTLGAQVARSVYKGLRR